VNCEKKFVAPAPNVGIPGRGVGADPELLCPEGFITKGFEAVVVLLAGVANVGLEADADCEKREVDEELSLVVVEAANKGFGGEEIGVVENKAGLSEAGVDGLKEGVAG
jgi:hypothetical protein